MTKICIAGAGPGGLLLGKELAKAGMDVTIFEACSEKAFYEKHTWFDALELSVLQDAGLPVPRACGTKWIGYGVKGQNTGLELYEPGRQTELSIYSPDYSEHTVTDVDFRFITVDRTALQRIQVEQAAAAGAKIVFGAKAAGLMGQTRGALADIDVKGIIIEKDGKQEEIPADLVVDATGQKAVLRTTLEPAEIGRPVNENLYGFVYRQVIKVKTTDVPSETVDFEHPPFKAHYRLRNSKGWLFLHPHSETQVDIGGAAVSMEQCMQNIDHVVERFPGKTGEVVGWATEKNCKGLPPDCLVASGFLVIGHAAAQVSPTNGCGIATTYMGALLAAQVLKRAKDFRMETLWEYGYRWMTSKGAHIAALFQRLKGMEDDETAFLIRHNIINAETLTNDYNVNYLPPSINELRRLEDVYPLNPALIDKWMRAEEASRRYFEYYSAYPPVWNPFALAKWRAISPDR